MLLTKTPQNKIYFLNCVSQCFPAFTELCRQHSPQWNVALTPERNHELLSRLLLLPSPISCFLSLPVKGSHHTGPLGMHHQGGSCCNTHQCFVPFCGCIALPCRNWSQFGFPFCWLMDICCCVYIDTVFLSMDTQECSHGISSVFVCVEGRLGSCTCQVLYRWATSHPP